MMAREKEQGKTAAANQLATELGVSVDEAKAIIARHREAEDQRKTDADREREAAAREKREAEEAKAEAARERHLAKLERAFLKAAPHLDDEQLAAVVRMSSVETGADDAAIKADVEKLQEKFPQLFKAEGDGDEPKPKPKPKAPSGDPTGTPPKPKQTDDAYSRGAERARAKYGKQTTSP
jgi:hypothetical protein